MAWYIDSNRIYVQEFQRQDKQIIARLQPIDYPTVMQYFGDESPVYQVTAKIAGDSKMTAIAALAKDGTVCALQTPIIEVANPVSYLTISGYISSLSMNMEYSMAQTFDPSADCDANVYAINFEFYRID